MQADLKPPAGRPLDNRVTSALLDAALSEVSEHGLEKTTVAEIAARAHTSKQAIYRRFSDKTELVAAALLEAFRLSVPPPPQRASVAQDLQQCLQYYTALLHQTRLGPALRSLVPHRREQRLVAVLDEVEASQRLMLRQVLIATPFESDMETRIDLLLGLIYFRILLCGIDIRNDDIERAIYLVLGLIAPREPMPPAGLPGL
ncbi:helix-turn-helix domain containing protein [Roseibium porphyridii]|uniref:Helix-turn-helix domain containing protein n=1 Tax=Roseibium porphyridii TaxID=2866279 RepID=A0ABY8F885_9HYPH|nr:TetR/AcrR family transcriptional regulator [Roseibium sp. KMA01]WFE91718.1 helix-turn-helix domain containing protein [Roseibium sp. KMA01]